MNYSNINIISKTEASIDITTDMLWWKETVTKKLFREEFTADWASPYWRWCDTGEYSSSAGNLLDAEMARSRYRDLQGSDV